MGVSSSLCWFYFFYFERTYTLLLFTQTKLRHHISDFELRIAHLDGNYRACKLEQLRRGQLLLLQGQQRPIADVLAVVPPTLSNSSFNVLIPVSLCKLDFITVFAVQAGIVNNAFSR